MKNTVLVCVENLYRELRRQYYRLFSYAASYNNITVPDTIPACLLRHFKRSSRAIYLKSLGIKNYSFSMFMLVFVGWISTDFESLEEIFIIDQFDLVLKFCFSAF